MRHARYWAEKAAQHEGRIARHEEEAAKAERLFGNLLLAERKRQVADKHRVLAAEAHRRAKAAS